jgi:hypothetical protein
VKRSKKKALLPTAEIPRTLKVLTVKPDHTPINAALSALIGAPLNATFVRRVSAHEDNLRAILVEPDEVSAVFAALCSMVLDVHAPEDQLTEEEWAKAQTIFKKFEDEMNRRLKNSKVTRRSSGG